MALRVHVGLTPRQTPALRRPVVEVIELERAPRAAPSLLDMVLQETLDRPGRELFEKVLRRTEVEMLGRRMAARNPWAEAARAAPRAQALAKLSGAYRHLGSAAVEYAIEEAIRSGALPDGFSEASQLGILEQILQQMGAQGMSVEPLVYGGGAYTWVTPDGWELATVPSEEPNIVAISRAFPWVRTTDLAQVGSLWTSGGLDPDLWISDSAISSSVPTWRLNAWTSANEGASPRLLVTVARNLSYVAGDPVPEFVPEANALPGGFPLGVAPAPAWKAAAGTRASDWPYGKTANNKGPPGPPGAGGLNTQEDEDRRRLRRRIPPPRVPPRPKKTRFRERKLRLGNYHGHIVVRVLEAATETSDLLGALFKALPLAVQRFYRNEYVLDEFAHGNRRPMRDPPDEYKARALWEQWRLLSPGPVVREVLWEYMSDMLHGAVGQDVAKLMQTGAKSSRISGGSGMMSPEWGDRDHDPMRPRIPEPLMKWMEGIVTQRAARHAAEDPLLTRDWAIRRGEATRRARANGEGTR